MTERTFGDEKSFELSKKKFLLDFMELSFSNSNLASFLIGKSSQASLPNIPLVPSSTNKNSGRQVHILSFMMYISNRRKAGDIKDIM